MDHKKDLQIINDLIGAKCERTLACNSIKLRFGCNVDKRGTTYIWIDPPWEFQQGDEALITTSLDYPDDDDINYEKHFKEWSELFSPLDNTKLISYQYTENKELELTFDGDYIIYVPFDKFIDENSWYHHWYVGQ